MRSGPTADRTHASAAHKVLIPGRSRRCRAEPTETAIRRPRAGLRAPEWPPLPVQMRRRHTSRPSNRARSGCMAPRWPATRFRRPQRSALAGVQPADFAGAARNDLGRIGQSQQRFDITLQIEKNRRGASFAPHCSADAFPQRRPCNLQGLWTVLAPDGIRAPTSNMAHALLLAILAERERPTSPGSRLVRITAMSVDSGLAAGQLRRRRGPRS